MTSVPTPNSHGMGGCKHSLLAQPSMAGLAGLSLPALCCWGKNPHQIGAGGASPAQLLGAQRAGLGPGMGALLGAHLLLEGLFSLKEVYGVKGLLW